MLPLLFLHIYILLIEGHNSDPSLPRSSADSRVKYLSTKAMYSS